MQSTPLLPSHLGSALNEVVAPDRALRMGLVELVCVLIFEIELFLILKLYLR